MGHSRNLSTNASSAANDPTTQKGSTFGSSEPADASAHLGFSRLRGVQWRTNLGILPSKSSAIDDFRRATADSRRRYATLRRRLLVDPHLCKDGKKSKDLSMDNPLSQNPDSPWVRLFQNAELEKMVEEDLSRLYPGQGSYFQTPECQAMLRRILLLWCVKNPECGYKQGMHELLAPLLYVLHVDLKCLSESQTRYREHFVDDISGILKKDEVSSRRLRSEEGGGINKGHDLQENNSGLGSNVDPDMWNIVLSSEPYGAEGELGAVLSERFLEHDGYSMFDALMGGDHGVVAMADFFSPNTGPKINSSSMTEDSAALYHLLSSVDSYLHDHLVELGVEPHYFALRWLRVLFVREFSLENLLLIWDEIFSASETDACLNQDPNFRLLSSPCGMFISSMAVSMILHIRSSLLASGNATSCLQKLLNFPENICATELIEKAKTLKDLDPEGSPPISSSYDHPLSASRSSSFRGMSSPLHTTVENYWEEQWRVLNKEQEQKKESRRNLLSGITRFYSGRFNLSGIESVTSPSRDDIGEKDGPLLVRRRSFDDLTQEANSLDFAPPCINSDKDGNLENNLASNTTDKGDTKDVTSSHSSRSNPHINRRGGSKVNAEVSAKAPPKPNSPGKHAPSSKEKKSLPGKFPWLFKFGKSSSGKSLGKGGNPPPQKSPFSTNAEKSNAKLPSPSQDRSSSVAKPDVKEGQSHAKEGQSHAKQAQPDAKEGQPDAKGGQPDAKDQTDAKEDRNTVGSMNLGPSIVKNVEIIEEFIEHARVHAGSFKKKSTDSIGTRQLEAIVALKELRKISKLLSDM